MSAREFDLGDVLSITTGILVSPRLVSGVYDILNFMTGDNLYTHQLGRASDECRPHLLKQYPRLACVDATLLDADHWKEWLAAQKAVFGETLSVEPLPAHAHEFIDPVSELVERGVHPDKIIAVEP